MTNSIDIEKLSGRYRGNLEFTDRQFRGWVRGAKDSTITMKVTDDSGNNVLWEGLCDEDRPGRKSSNTKIGFRFALNGGKMQATDQLRFFDSNTGVELPFSPYQIDAQTKAWIEWLNKLSHWPFLHVSSLQQKNGKLFCSIFIAGNNTPDQLLPLMVETKKGLRSLTQDEIKLKPAGTQRGTTFWHAPSFPEHLFVLDLTEAFKDAMVDDAGISYVTLKVTENGISRDIIDEKHIGLIDPQSVKYPPEENVRRVQAKGDVHQKFTLQAYLNYRTYRDVYEKYGSNPWKEIQAAFDWGCGCGRVTQQLMHNLGADRVHGADIDAGNIEWCLNNLNSKNFTVCDTNPPLAYDDNSFDYIIATSVFTHIYEELVGPWLEELNRVLKPAAIAALTVGSETRVAFGAYGYERLKNLESRGIEDHIPNKQLDTSIDDKDYYRNVRMTKKYIRETWSKYIDVVEILDHGIGAQDIVVCRGR